MDNRPGVKVPLRIPLALAALLLVVVGLAAAGVFADNIDPNSNGSKYAWGENAGWLNAKPAGCGGCGITVASTKLTGYMWGENIGWLNLNCENAYGVGCAGSPGGNWGVTNDGAGNLGGLAWGENVGWINFSCQNHNPTPACASVGNFGVTINTSTGVFSGKAWGENMGWITFSSAGPVVYKVQTAGPCASSAAPWSIPTGDGDCDGFPSTVAAGVRGPESSIGTLPLVACAATTTPNDENPDAWPVDNNDDRKAGLSDILAYIPVFGSQAPNPPYNARFDLNADNKVGLQDILMFIPFFNITCTP